MSSEHDPTNPRVTELFKVIADAHEELETIRKACPHTTFTVGMWEWGVGRWLPQRICDQCGINIPGITDEESANVWAQWNARIQILHDQAIPT